MRKKDRAELVMLRLNAQYPETPIPLDHSDPFTLLIAVLLSAQCTDKKVNEVTPALFAAGPDPAAMAALEESDILGYIRQLGLARTKAKNVRRLAQLLLERHAGQVPPAEALEAGGRHKQQAGDVAAFGPGLSRGHAHPPAGPTLGAERRRQREADRTGSENPISTGCVEPPASSNYFLRARILHRPWLRRQELPSLPRALPQPSQAGHHEEALIS